MDPFGGGSTEKGSDGPGPSAGGAGEPGAPGSPGWTIGPHRVVSILGEGGFGVVYLAEQREPVQRRVAVKVVKPGMDSRGVLTRFEQERRALAVMDHPNVARMFDAGTTSDGRPYFVMEYVDGEPLLQHCDRRRLGIRERLELFASVCDGVQHAHAKGVAHRDLKPGNILVETAVGGGAVAKVIDFGIAKALEQGVGEQTVFTEHGVLIGTPDYMSPEQASLGAVDVDTRTDVYSLGVVLYELLTGALPFDPWRLRGQGFDEVRRMIREVDPPRPGARLTELGEEAEPIAALRGMRLADLRAALHRELEWIPLKAMRKDREERYATASDMAEDVRRYLSGRPLKAGPESAPYRAWKFVRRNRGKVAATTALAMTLATGAVVSTTFAVREARQRRAAEAAERAAERRAQELAQMMTFQESQLSGINAVRMGDLIREGILEMGRKDSRGDEGAPEERRAWEAGLTGVNFTDVALRSLEVEVFDRALEAAERDFERQPLLRARTLQTLSNTLRELGRLERAAPAQIEALRIRRAALGDEHPDTMASMHFMSELLRRQERLSEAEAYARETLERRRRLLGSTHPDTMTSIDHLGDVLQAQRRFDAAEPFYVEALAARRATLGDTHPDTLRSINNMGGLLQAQGRYEDAEPLLTEALVGRMAALGPDHRDTLNSISNMGSLMERMGRLDEAREYWTEALMRRQRALGSEHPSTLFSVNNLAGLHNEQGDFARARELLEASEAAARWIHTGESVGWLGNYLAKLGVARAGLGDFAGAEEALLEAYEMLVEGFEPGNPRIAACAQSLASLYEAWDRAAPGEGHDLRAAEWGAKAGAP